MRILFIYISIFILITAKSAESDFTEIDNVISNAISERDFPGAQLLIGDENNILYKKNYGNFTYDDYSPAVDDESIFDIASVTKVTATTTAIMILYNENKLDINDNVSKYIPEFSNNGKENIKILNLLIHNSGLIAWIPFYKYYNSGEEVLNAIFNAELDYSPETKSVYSDLNAILLGIVVERISGMKLDEFCAERIFKPLKMESTLFNPEEKVKDKILPTENDNYWRMRLIKGEVHDEAASILGGVSGNAGLFSNSDDLYKFMRVMLNQGNYYNPYSRGLKEEKLFSSDISEKFTTVYKNLNYENSRALGWDTKPLPGNSKYRIPCGELISENCFGHTGYTGTSIWCDKDRKLIIIFLTNRIYPSRDNEGIRSIRPEIHNKAIELSEELKEIKN